MKCKNCGNDMYLAFTGEWICRDCGIKRDENGKFISRDVKSRSQIPFMNL